MTRPLLVAVAHGVDLLTFLGAVALLGIQGEANGIARIAYAAGGLPTVVALKVSGTAALALITTMRSWALIPAAGAGIAGAAVNLVAIAI